MSCWHNVITNLWQWVRREVSGTLLSEQWLTYLANFHALYIGFSGGLDSTVLLHCLAKHLSLKSKLQAIHINHGLSLNAQDWQKHCQKFCETLHIPLLIRDVIFEKRANIEEAARLARYRAFSSVLTEKDGLLLGHHADDQAETVLLQLFRGAGIDGIAAMSPINKLATGSVIRPFLGISRAKLEAYASQHQLTWIEDESNGDEAFSRNYLRHQIIPALQTKWPGLVRNLARTANHCQQAKLNLVALAEIDGGELRKETLSLINLRTLENERLINVLRAWLKNNKVRFPSTTVLQTIIKEIIFANVDTVPLVQWDGISVRRYKQTLYLLKKDIEHPASRIEWGNFPAPLQLDKKGCQHLHAFAGPGLKIPLNSQLQIRFREGGESLRWRGQTKQLKKLFQEWNIPPWQRDQIPLLFINAELAAVVGFAISDHYYSIESLNTYFIELHLT